MNLPHKTSADHSQAHDHSHADDDHAHSHAAHQHGHSHAHAHGHGHSLPTQAGNALAIGIVLNLAFVVVEYSLGAWSHSLALIADATHNLGDVLGLLLAWGATHLSRRAPSARFTYGLGASSILAALANALLLVLVTGALMWEAVHRLQDPQPLQGAVVIAVALAGVVVNGATAWLLHRGHEHDLNMRGAYLHMLADAAVSVAVAVSGAVILLTNWLWLDPAMTLAVGVFIVWGTLGLLREATSLALQGVPGSVESAQVRGYLGRLAGVDDVHDLHIWAMSTTESAMTAHLVCSAGHPGDAFLDEAAHEIGHRFGIRHVTLQVEIGHCGKSC